MSRRNEPNGEGTCDLHDERWCQTFECGFAHKIITLPTLEVLKPMMLLTNSVSEATPPKLATRLAATCAVLKKSY